MSKTTHRYAACLMWGGDVQTGEADVEVEYDVHWGRAAQTSGPPERCYEADPPEIDNIRILTVDGQPNDPAVKDFYHRMFMEQIVSKLEMDHFEAMIDNATQDQD